MQVHTLSAGVYARARVCDNHRCHNKNPWWKIGLGREWRHARKRWGGILGDFEKKAVSWDLTLDEASWFLSLGEASPVGDYGMRRAFVWSDGTVSIVKIVSLSPRVEILKVKNVNKRFVPELQRVVSVLRILGFLIMWTFYRSVYFKYSYFEYVT